MTPQLFRQLVKDEVRTWLEGNVKGLGKLIGVLADSIAPRLEEEITRGLMKRVGQLDPDERDQAAELLDLAADALRTAAGRQPKFDDTAASLAEMCQAMSQRLSQTVKPRPNDAAPTF